MSDTNHDNVTSRFSGMFNDFLTAAKAMEQLPQLQQAMEDAKALAEQHKASADTAGQLYNEAQGTIADLNAKITTLEASLDSASKSTGDLQARYDLLVHTLRDLGGGIATTLSVVEPPPAPTVQEDPDQRAVDPTEASSAPVADTTSTTAPVTTTSEGQSATDPTMSTGTTKNEAFDPSNGPGIGSGPSDPSGAEPMNASEAQRRRDGKDWISTDGDHHDAGWEPKPSAAEAPVTPVVPFDIQRDSLTSPEPFTPQAIQRAAASVASTDAQSTTATSPDGTSTLAPAAPPSDDVSPVLPDWITRRS